MSQCFSFTGGFGFCRACVFSPSESPNVLSSSYWFGAIHWTILRFLSFWLQNRIFTPVPLIFPALIFAVLALWKMRGSVFGLIIEFHITSKKILTLGHGCDSWIWDGNVILRFLLCADSKPLVCFWFDFFYWSYSFFRWLRLLPPVWIDIIIYCSSFYNYLWTAHLEIFHPNSTDFNEILHSSARLKREILWADNFNQFLHPWGERFQIKPVTIVAGTESDTRKKTTLQGSSRPWRNNKNEQARSCTWVEENAKQNVAPWILKDLLSLKTLHALYTTEMPVILPSKPTKQ